MVKRLRLSPLTAATGVRIPLESPKKLISDAPKRPFFYTPVLRLVSRPATGCTLARLALAVRRIPLESPTNRKYERFYVRIFLYTPVLRLVSRHATGCTLARFALAVRRIPLESPKKLISDAPKCPFFYTPVLRLVLRPATGCTLARLALAVREYPIPTKMQRDCTLARLALAVRRIPLESPKKLISDAPKRPFFYTPVLHLVSRPATGCTLAVRRILSKPVKNFARFGARSFLFFPRKLSLPQPANCEL